MYYKLTHQIYVFEKEFRVLQEFDENSNNFGGDHILTKVTADLHIDFACNSFYIDLNKILDQKTRLVFLPTVNCFGNYQDNIFPVVEMYRWLASIAEFAKGAFEGKVEPSEVEQKSAKKSNLKEGHVFKKKAKSIADDDDDENLPTY